MDYGTGYQNGGGRGGFSGEEYADPATTAMNPVIRLAIVPKAAKYVIIAISLVIFPEIVLNPPRARHVIVAARLDISRGSVLNKRAALLHKVECAAPDPTATNVARLVILHATVQ